MWNDDDDDDVNCITAIIAIKKFSPFCDGLYGSNVFFACLCPLFYLLTIY